MATRDKLPKDITQAISQVQKMGRKNHDSFKNTFRILRICWLVSELLGGTQITMSSFLPQPWSLETWVCHLITWLQELGLNCKTHNKNCYPTLPTWLRQRQLTAAQWYHQIHRSPCKQEKVLAQCMVPWFDYCFTHKTEFRFWWWKMWLRPFKKVVWPKTIPLFHSSPPSILKAD